MNGLAALMLHSINWPTERHPIKKDLMSSQENKEEGKTIVILLRKESYKVYYLPHAAVQHFIDEWENVLSNSLLS